MWVRAHGMNRHIFIFRINSLVAPLFFPYASPDETQRKFMMFCCNNRFSVIPSVSMQNWFHAIYIWFVLTYKEINVQFSAAIFAFFVQEIRFNKLHVQQRRYLSAVSVWAWVCIWIFAHVYRIICIFLSLLVTLFLTNKFAFLRRFFFNFLLLIFRLITNWNCRKSNCVPK